MPNAVFAAVTSPSMGMIRSHHGPDSLLFGRSNAIRQHNKRVAADHYASKQLPISFKAWRQHSHQRKDRDQAVQRALHHWLHASLATAFAAWRDYSGDRAVLKEKLQHAVAIMSQVWHTFQSAPLPLGWLAAI